MDIKNFEKYLKICRKYGVNTLKIADFEIKLDEFTPKQKSTDDKENIQLSPTYTEDEILNWSSTPIA